MCPVLAMILAAGMTVPGNGPEKVSGEMEQGLDLSGKWEGIYPHPLSESRVGLTDGRFVELVNNLSLFLSERVIDEGKGRLRVRMCWDADFVGIYRQEGNNLTICCRYACEGYPTSFQIGKHQVLYLLHRVKPAK